ncbi:hypothetical protein [Mesorhizobium sp. M0139]|uniref:hypothetical protein n=1 Tax=Mesorhizobium sp. M0139 TaxID=2956892 RepID=UPI00333B6537
MQAKLGVKLSTVTVTSRYVDGLIERSGAYYSAWLRQDGRTEAVSLPAKKPSGSLHGSAEPNTAKAK